MFGVQGTYLLWVRLWGRKGLGLGLELIGEFEERAHKNNCRPLLELLERARTEFTERLEFLEPTAQAISEAR
jgi:hypothetical protein